MMGTFDKKMKKWASKVFGDSSSLSQDFLDYERKAENKKSSTMLRFEQNKAELLMYFGDEFPNLVAGFISTSREDLIALEGAMDLKDIEQIRMFSHRIKMACRRLMVEDIASLAERLEMDCHDVHWAHLQVDVCRIQTKFVGFLDALEEDFKSPSLLFE